MYLHLVVIMCTIWMEYVTSSTFVHLCAAVSGVRDVLGALTLVANYNVRAVVLSAASRRFLFPNRRDWFMRSCLFPQRTAGLGSLAEVDYNVVFNIRPRALRLY